MLQRNISGESASIKVSIEIEEFQQPVTFTCDGMYLLLELSLLVKDCTLSPGQCLSVFVIVILFCPWVSGAGVVCGKCGKGN